MAVSNEYAFSAVLEIGGIDKVTLDNAISKVKEEWRKNVKLEMPVDEASAKQIKDMYTSAWREASSFQGELNKALRSNAQGLQLLYKEAVDYALFKVKEIENAFKGTDFSPETKSSRISEKSFLNKKIAEDAAEAAGATKKLGDAQKVQQAQSDSSEKSNKKLADSYKKVSDNTSETKGFVEQFTDGLKKGAGTFSAYYIGVQLVTQAINALSQIISTAITDIIDLNKAMTSLQMVSGDSASSIYESFSKYNEMAKELGATTKDMVEGADMWIRQGKSVEQTNALLTASTIQSKLANIDAATSTDLLTSTLNGYQMAAEDAMHVVDALTAIDFAAATSVQELAVALQKTANTARESGVEFETLAGYIAAVSENTRQAPELIGNAFRTLFTRMQNVKAGKAIDEYGDSLNEVETVLNRFDIKLRDSQMEFRSMEDVLDDVNASWDSFASTEKSQIAVAIAGTRQREVFISLMDNYAQALEYATLAMNADGEATQRYAVYLDSLEARLNELQATWEAIIYDQTTVEFFKNTLSFLTDLLKLIPAVAVVAAGAFAAVNPPLAILIGALGLLISNWDRVSAFFSGDEEFFLDEQIVEISDSIKETTSDITELQTAIENLNQKKIDGIITPEEEELLTWYKNEVKELKNELKALEQQSKSKNLEKSLVSNEPVTLSISDPMSGGIKEGQMEINSKNLMDTIAALNEQMVIEREGIDAVNERLLEGSIAQDIADTAIRSHTKSIIANQLELDNLIKTFVEFGKEVDEAEKDGAEVEQAYRDLRDESLKYREALAEQTEGQNNAKDSSGDLGDEIETLTSIYATLKTSTSSLVDAYNQMNTNNQITLETAIKLIDSHADLADAIRVENGVITISKKVLQEKFNMELEGHKITMRAQLDAAKQNAQTTRIKLENYAAELAALKLVQSANLDLVYIEYARMRALDVKQGKEAQAYKEQLQAITDIQKKLQLLDTISISTFTPASSTSSATSAAEKAAKAYIAAITKQLDKEIDLLQKDKDYWKDYYDDKIEGIKDVIDALDEQTKSEGMLLEIEKKKAELMKANQEVVRIYRRDQGFVYEKNLEAVANAQSELDILLKEWDTYQKKLQLEQQVQDFEDAKDATLEDIDEEIERLQDLKDQWSDALDIKDEVDEFGQYLDDLKGFETASYEERLTMLHEFVENYNKEMARMRSSSGSSGGGGGGSSDSVSNPNTGGSALEKLAFAAEQAASAASAAAKKLGTTSPTGGAGASGGGTGGGGRAIGTAGENYPGIKALGERGMELGVVNKGDGVLTHRITSNLMKWGEMDPFSYARSMNEYSGSPKSESSTINQFNFDQLVLPGVTNAEQLMSDLSERGPNVALQVTNERK